MAEHEFHVTVVSKHSKQTVLAPQTVLNKSVTVVLLNYSGYPIPEPIVVAVEEGDDFSMACFKSPIECGGLSTIFFLDQSDPVRIVSLDGPNDRNGLIVRSIVNYDDFKFSVALIQDRLDGFRNETIIVVVVDYYRNERFTVHALESSGMEQ